VLEQSFMTALIFSITGRYSGRIFAVSAPLPSEDIAPAYGLVAQQGEMELFDELFAAILRDREITYFPQPPETKSGDLWTKKEHSIVFANVDKWGTARATEWQKRAAYSHMTGRYGAAVLSAVRDRLYGN
jgi:hypothetical protein